MTVNPSDPSQDYIDYLSYSGSQVAMTMNPNDPSHGGLADFLALDYIDDAPPPLIYLASPYGDPSPAVREARVEAVRLVCGELVNAGKIVLSPIVYSCGLAPYGYRPPQGWYAFDLQLLARADELLVLQLPGWEQSPGVVIEIAAAQARNIPVRLMKPEAAGLPAVLLAELQTAADRGGGATLT